MTRVSVMSCFQRTTVIQNVSLSFIKYKKTAKNHIYYVNKMFSLLPPTVTMVTENIVNLIYFVLVFVQVDCFKWKQIAVGYIQ